ncbi:MAG: hypothetical protein OEY63_07330 [Gemmatimonadota bacterium]|nr:hypothetical protein [Gemmatimonadota bacterium]
MNRLYESVSQAVEFINWDSLFVMLRRMFLVIIVSGSILIADVARSQGVPSAESVLDEALKLVMQHSRFNDLDGMLEVVRRQIRVRSCAQANNLFRSIIQSHEELVRKHAYQSGVKSSGVFLEKLIAVQRSHGCVADARRTFEYALVSYQEQNRERQDENVGKNSVGGADTLTFPLDLAELYLAIGDYDAAKRIASEILGQIRTAKWRPPLEFERAAIVLARIERDEGAFEVVDRYEQHFDAQIDGEVDRSVLHRWIYPERILAAIAEEQAQAGHGKAARATLRKAIVKTREIPVSLLSKMYGERMTEVNGEIGMIGEGDALQSAGALSIVDHASRIGEMDLAQEAFELASPLANETAATGMLIHALSRHGEISKAKKLLDTFDCSSHAIILGLLDKQDWTGAIEAEIAYHKSTCCKRVCNFFEQNSDYVIGLGKAKTFTQGSASALTWARKQSEFDAVYALLGVVDALIEIDQEKSK